MRDENKELREQIRQLRNDKSESAERQVSGKLGVVQKLQRDVDLLVADNRKKAGSLDDLKVK